MFGSTSSMIREVSSHFGVHPICAFQKKSKHQQHGPWRPRRAYRGIEVCVGPATGEQQNQTATCGFETAKIGSFMNFTMQRIFGVPPFMEIPKWDFNSNDWDLLLMNSLGDVRLHPGHIDSPFLHMHRSAELRSTLLLGSWYLLISKHGNIKSTILIRTYIYKYIYTYIYTVYTFDININII